MQLHLPSLLTLSQHRKRAYMLRWHCHIQHTFSKGCLLWGHSLTFLNRYSAAIGLPGKLISNRPYARANLIGYTCDGRGCRLLDNELHFTARASALCYLYTGHIVDYLHGHAANIVIGKLWRVDSRAGAWR